ncbi:hypothetical protein [Puniceicoccus vermicola]|uniref:Uncharacterized protein n=1 Tax=Puniceicoccus vermicola TaxID=388746 RepID=A0A7X1E7H3_9BACT|nr:hypothetical protein [Puniceicoccus vermicola]MBC2603742.1 hypothetical protein [Puniceicoccus vermicola]
MNDNPYKQKVSKTVGWLLFAIGIIAAVQVLMTQNGAGADSARTIGQVVGPVLISLVGLYFAGVFTKAR